MTDGHHNRDLPAGITGPRPEWPRPEVLDVAANALAAYLGTTTPTWEIAERRERTRSTIFVLVARHRQGTTRAFYKAERLRDQDVVSSRFEHQVALRRQALEGEQRLSSRLADAFEREAIRFDRPLAIRVDLLTGVRLAVPGARLGRAVWYSLPGRRRASLRLFETIGRASRIIEEVGRSLGTPPSAQEYRRRLQGAVDRVGSVLTAREHQGVADTFERLSKDVDFDRYVLWSHGDLSPGNLLVERGRVGVIDFSWRPQLMCRDVVVLLDRIRSQSLQPKAWTKQVVEAVTNGYGIDTNSAEWRLALLHRLVRNAQRPEARLRAQALQDLPALISSS